MHLLRTFIYSQILIQSVLLAEVDIAARFKPARIAMGDQAQYIVEITESSTNSQPTAEAIKTLPIPEVSGLILRNGRISSGQQTTITNGVARYAVTQSLIIDATPQKVGTYKIPEYTLSYKGQSLRVPEATLQVVERSADAGPRRDELVFLKADVPDEIYIGQMVPVQLKLYLEESVRLTGLNSFDRTADGFTISELPEDSSEGVEISIGRRYRTLTWPLTLTPIQAGKQELSFQFGLTARLPGQNDRDPLRRSPFGGSLLEDFFGRSEQLNVYTDALSIDVLPLPEQGRPKSFTGAIGDLAMEVASDSQATTEGEPIMLSVVLKGRGNFERIGGPEFPESSQWKHYSPETQFESKDPNGLSGSLRFDYVFIPQASGDLELPETRFSYFDPAQKEYVELIAPAIAVKVAASRSNFNTPPIPGSSEQIRSDLQLRRALSSEEALLTLEYRPGPAQTVGLAILKSPGFIGANFLTALAITGAALLIRKSKRNREDPAYRIRVAARRSLRQARTAYRQALQQNDADAFYQNGQNAIRLAATIQSGYSLHSADSAEIAKLLSEPLARDCHEFFRSADARRFGGQSQQSLDEATGQLERILKGL